MKHTLLFAVLSCMFFAGCHDHEPNENKHCIVTHKYVRTPHHSGDSTAYSEYIPVDSADKMINSYLNSINYQENDTDLHALIYNADSLRAFLVNNPKIVNVKFMFAHTLDYINNGGQNQYAGYQSGALTLVLAGYDVNNNYVYYNTASGQMVKDHCMPCPDCCPVKGTAASDTLPVQSTTRK